MTTLVNLLEARKNDDQPALRDGSISLSWRQVIDQARSRATWLRSHQLNGPPHLGVLLPNSVDYVLWIFAAAYARWAVVGINPTRQGAALGADITGADCQLIITDHASISMLSGLDLANATSNVHLAEAANLEAKDLDPHNELDATADDLLLLLFTSGTTGAPKAVRCTQGRLAGIGETAAQAYGYQRDDVCYCPMPLFHGNALMALIAPALFVGASVVLPSRFTASRFLDDVQESGATMFTYVGKAISYILATPVRQDDRENKLTRGFGTEASSADRQRFEERFGCRLIDGYGASEGGVAIITTPDTPKGALGPMAPGMDLAVLDPVTGEEKERAVFDDHGTLTNGTESIGELVNRSGIGKFEGYYKNEQAASSRLRNGWYWTGDLAYQDQAGYFYFAGRSGDWLRVDSENLAANSIEEALSRYEPFLNVAVYPVPDFDAGGGDLVMATVEIDSGPFLPHEFFAWWQSQSDVGTKWLPTFLRVTTKIDETATGKMTKVRLRNETWHGEDEIWYRPARANAFHQLSEAEVRAIDGALAVQRSTAVDA